MHADPKMLKWEDAVVWLRAQPDRQQLVVDAFYDDPLIAAARRYFESHEWQAVSNIFRGHQGKALDVGAGRGIASYALGCSGFTVTALEPDPSAIVGAAAIRALAAEAKLPIEVIDSFSEHLPFADNTFDVAFARAVLHHTSDLNGACREICHVLAPGGIFVAAREHVISREADLGRFLDQHPLHYLYGGEHAFLLDRYIGALKDAGFTSVEVLSPLTSSINLFPYTTDTLRDAIIDKLSRTIPTGPVWRLMLSSLWIFHSLLSMAERFDNRAGRLYSFVCRKATS
jgi:SAM-dependent methyltransferase